MRDLSIDVEISDIEETFRSAEEEFNNILSLRYQAILLARVSDQHNTLSGGKEEEKSSGGSKGNNESLESTR